MITKFIAVSSGWRFGRFKKGRSNIHLESMKRKEGNAKALRCFFHKGARMKWLVAILVLFLAPGSVQADSKAPKRSLELFDVSTLPLHTFILDGKVKPQGGSDWVRLAKFPILALRDLPNIRTHIRLFFTKDLSPGAYPKGRCYIKIKGQGAFPLRDHFIYTAHGPEVWVPHLMDRQLAEIFILWEPDAPLLQYARSVVGDEPFQRKGWWLIRARWESMLRIKVKDRPALFRELTLDEVCAKHSREEIFPFSEQDLKTFQY